MTLVSQMRGTPPAHVVRMRTAPTVGPKPPLLKSTHSLRLIGEYIQKMSEKEGKSAALSPEGTLGISLFLVVFLCPIFEAEFDC